MKNSNNRKNIAIKLKKQEKGVTLIALVITIIAMIILASISIGGAISGQKQAEDSRLKSELRIIQNAILQRKEKADLIGTPVTDLPGDTISKDDVALQLTSLNIPQTLKGINYKKLSQESQFKELGITNFKDTYIVNYATGEAYNITTPQTSTGEFLCIYSKESE